MLTLVALGGGFVAWLVISTRGAKYAVPLNLLILAAVVIRVVNPAPASATHHGCGMGAMAATLVYGVIGVVAFVTIFGSLLAEVAKETRREPLPCATITISSGDRLTARPPPNPRLPRA